MSLRNLFKSRMSEPETITIACGSELFGIRVCRNRQARRYTLRINAATREVVLTVPPRGNLRDAQAFAEKHGDWIATRLERIPEPVAFSDGVVIPLRGTAHRIVHRRGMRGTVWVEIGAQDHGPQLCVAGDGPHVGRRVQDFLKREAKRDLMAASARAADRIGVEISRVVIRDQVSRWGSCSINGVLSYSWRLVLAPPFVLDYLAAHEVAHLVEMNHSRRFWRLVAQIEPEFVRAKKWLDLNGANLHRFGASQPAAAVGKGADAVSLAG